MLNKWFLVAEWMDVDGQRWLSRLASPTATAWDIQGMAHNTLYEAWDEDE